MDYRINHPDFQKHELALRRGIRGNPAQLLLDGKIVYGYLYSRTQIKDDHGRERRVKFKGAYPFDLLPPVEIDGVRFHVAPPLRVWQIIWLSIPFVLVPTGGASGVVIGGVALYANFSLFRGPGGTPDRYLLSGLVNFGSFALFFLLGLALRTLLH